MDLLEHCPLCKHETFRPHRTCRDHTASGERFTIVECEACSFRFTNPRPSADEMGRYYESADYTPHQDASQGLLDVLYRGARLYTLRSKHRLVSSLVPHSPGRLLDFGCGTGEFLNLCQSRGWDVQGLEPDPQAQTLAAQKYGLAVDDPEQLRTMPDNHFDAITLWHVLEHVPDLVATVEQLKRTLAPGGTLLVAVPNCASFDAQFYGADWAAYDVPRHLSHFRPDDVRRLAAHAGLTVSDIRAMRLDAVYVSLLSEQARDGWLLRAPVVAALSILWAARHKHRHSAQLYLLRHTDAP